MAGNAHGSTWLDTISQIRQRFNQFGSINEFAKISCNEDRIKFIYSFEEILDSIKHWLGDVGREKLVKCSDRANQLRENGNDFFKRKVYEEAVKKYTESVFTAPSKDDELLSLSYANRSAALFYMQQYQESLKDIDRALVHNYKKSLAYKLYIRKGHCLEKIEDKRHYYQKALEYLEFADLTRKRKAVLQEEIYLYINAANTDKINTGTKIAHEIPMLVSGNHPDIEFASSAIKLNYSTEKGRYITADQYIKEGSTLFHEKPFASILLPHFMLTHCHHCQLRIPSLIPCNYCCQAGFCSDECCQESWDKYHQYECRIMDVLFKVGIAHLSLRVLLMAGIQNLIDWKKCLTTLNHSMPGLNENGKYISSSYYSVYHLVNHSKSFQTEDIFCHALTAILLLTSLDPITKANGEKFIFEVDFEYIGALLMHHSEQLISNAHAITDILEVPDERNSNVRVVEEVRVATAIYPSASLMNHSCNPNIISSFYKNCLILRATRCIHKDEEVYNCYGPHFKRMAYNERQEALSEQYFFHCKCDVCRDDLASLPVEGYAKPNEKLELALNYMESGSYDDAVKILKKCLSESSKHLPQHHKGIVDVQDKLAFCYAQQGNYLEACDILRNSLASIKVAFGDESIETAHELQKFSDVLVCALLDPVQTNATNGNQFSDLLAEAIRVVEKALNIFTVFYGSWHRDTEDMSKTMEQLQDFLQKNVSVNK